MIFRCYETNFFYSKRAAAAELWIDGNSWRACQPCRTRSWLEPWYVATPWPLGAHPIKLGTVRTESWIRTVPSPLNTAAMVQRRSLFFLFFFWNQPWGCSADPFSTCLDLFQLISSHIILFILPAEYYSLDQPNRPLLWGKKEEKFRDNLLYY